MGRATWALNNTRNRMVFRWAPICKCTRISARHGEHAKAEDKKLRKDPTFGGPCFEGTLQKVPTESGFPNHVPWPERLRTSRPRKVFDAGRRRELQQNHPASH